MEMNKENEWLSAVEMVKKLLYDQENFVKMLHMHRKKIGDDLKDKATEDVILKLIKEHQRYIHMMKCSFVHYCCFFVD
jgi:DNA-binding ferritin-like protein